MSKKPLRNKCLYTRPRYWYHISTTLSKQLEYLTPWSNSMKTFNRGPCEPNNERICVAPTVEQCLTAVPYAPGDTFTVYRTARKCKANKPSEVHDAHITGEGWIQEPMMFQRFGVLSLPRLSKSIGKDIIEEAGSNVCLQRCGKVLKWWQRRNLKRHIK